MSDETHVYKAEQKALTAEKNWPAMALIAIGAGLLLANIFQVQLINILWPGFVILPGLLLLWPAQRSTESYNHPLSFLAVPGAIITTTGLLLFVMNITNHFEAWAYAWTLVLAGAAAGLSYIYRFEPDRGIHETVHKFTRVMLYLFIGFAIFFELVVFGTLTPWLPLALIAYGVFMLSKEKRQKQAA
ncbi:MAG: hypothetical protein H6658_01000 [Ardenticatenaceae bacterium]|nr:hypothetical protein [Ardenticatenaceae bacterium]